MVCHPCLEKNPIGGSGKEEDGRVGHHCGGLVLRNEF